MDYCNTNHSAMAFNSNMASRVTLACCQSLCDVLSELPLPTAVAEKTAHTRTLVTGGLNVQTRNGLLDDFRLVPHLRQALFMAKQQLADVQLTTTTTNNNGTADSSGRSGTTSNNTTPGYNGTNAGIVSSPSVSNDQANLPPSQLLLRLGSEGAFGPSFYPAQHSSSASSGTNNSSNLNDLHADLHTIEPSIDKHMADLHQNLMNDLINDDCDMSSSMAHNANSANDLYAHHHGHQQPSLPQAHQQTTTTTHNNTNSNNQQPQIALQASSQYQQQLDMEVQQTQQQPPPQQQPPQAQPSVNNNNAGVRAKREASNDHDWKMPLPPPPPPPVARKPKTEAVPRKSASAAFREKLAERKPQTKSVKYEYSDFDSGDTAFLTSNEDIVVRFETIIDDVLASCNDNNEYGNDSDGEDYHHEGKHKRKRKSYEDDNHVNGGISFNVNITPEQIKEITVLSARLKQTNRVVEIERKKIILFLTVLSNQLNLWFTHYKSKAALALHDEDGLDEGDELEKSHFWQLCCNASQSALHIMTSTAPNNDKASLISLEELIEFVVDFLSNNLSSTTHVTTNTSSKSKKAGHTVRHLGVSKVQVSKWTQLLQLLFEFVTLRSRGSLTDSLILSLTRISMNALFLLQNTIEMQTVAIEMLCHVFEEYPRHRLSILEELMQSLAKIPTKKSHRKDSVLTQMLIRLTNAFYVNEAEGAQGKQAQHTRDSLAKQSNSALHTVSGFLHQFLIKCYTSPSSADVDFKLIFESLLNDLLEHLHSPYHTSAILLVQIIIKILISFLGSQQSKAVKAPTLPQRLVAIEYLSIICSKFAQFIAEKPETVKELEKTLSTIEECDKPVEKKRKKDKNKDKEKDKAAVDANALVSKIWKLLVNYFNSEKLYREKLVLASVWIKEKYFADNEQLEAKFLETLNQVKVDEEREESVIDVSTASLCTLYMEFVHFSTNQKMFDMSIMHLTASLSFTTNTTQRSRAMKCLSSILGSSSIESATQLLQRNDLQNAMKSALLDPSTSVREATVDLIGRFVLQSRDISLCQRYCDLIGERVLDTGISVRKRVIKMLRDFCIEFPEFDKCGEMACKIVKRINDDGEGIRRLVVETCRDLWFVNNNQTHIKYKVYSLLHVIATIINDNQGIESMQSLFDQLVKEDTMPIAQQICDCIMSDILIDMTQTTKIIQLAAIQCVSMLSQCCPKLMVKHLDTLQSLLSLTCETLLEISLRIRVIQTIDRVLPHVNNPSIQLLNRIEEDMIKNILSSPAQVIQSSIKCLSVSVKNHTKNNKVAVDLFKKFQTILYTTKTLLYEGAEEEKVKPKLCRAIYTCGLFTKYFSHIIAEFKDGVRDAFIGLIHSPYQTEIKCRSIAALGFVIESDPRICLLPAVVDIYTNILRGTFVMNGGNADAKQNEFCVQVLNNFRSYLSESIESDEQAVKTIQWSQESLKTMASHEDDSCSTQSQIIQKYLSSILINALNPNIAIRRAAGNVIHVIHSGGHVHPLQLVPHLVAMTSDDDQTIRVRADHVLSEIERKYHGYVAMKSKEAVQLTGIFCKRLGCHGYRIYLEKTANVNNESSGSASVTNTREICARLSTLYQVIATNRQSRRGFVTSLLRHLDISAIVLKHSPESNVNDPSAPPGFDQPTSSANASGDMSEQPDVTYFVENVLFFPYTVFDEILFILNTLECNNSINSTHMASLFKEIFIVDKAAFAQERSAQHQQQQQQQQQMQMNTGYGQQAMVNSYGGFQQQPPIMQMDAYGGGAYPDLSAFQQQPPLNSFGNNQTSFMDNLPMQDIDDLDLDNEESFKKYENYIHVNFDLLMNDQQTDRLETLWKCLHTIYLSNLLRTLLKEFYVLKDEKINEYSTSDTKTWEKAVHRRQIESRYLQEIFDLAKPKFNVPTSLLMVKDLSQVERELLEELRRFKQIALNSVDHNVKPQMILKLFQAKSAAPAVPHTPPANRDTPQAMSSF